MILAGPNYPARPGFPGGGLFCPCVKCHARGMDPHKELGKATRRIEEFEAAIEKLREATWQPRQTLPKLRHAIALILQQLKQRE